MTKITKIIPLFVTIVLALTITGCGNSSNSKQESAPVKQVAADDTSQLCSTVQGTGLANKCTVNSRGSTVDVVIDSYDDEVARNVCADISDKLTQLTTHFSVPWKLQIFSPYRIDKSMASCLLH